ncbi:MAG: LytR/AlgR family response regulator transcription factor [Bacteroidota bacterium]|jgi:two-component system response regulator LytT
MRNEKNCLIVDDDSLSRLLFDTVLNKLNSFDKIFHCDCMNSCLDIVSKEKIDLVFLDVHMPGKSGLELIPILKKNEIQVVLISSDISNAFHGYENNIIDFVLKPPTLERVGLTIKKIENELNKKYTYNYNDIFVKNGKSRIEKISILDICFVESIGNHIGFYLSNNKRIVTSGTLKSVEEKISNHFIRVHNSYLVRLDKITAIEGNCVIVNKKAIPVSRSNWKTLEKKLVFL